MLRFFKENIFFVLLFAVNFLQSMSFELTHDEAYYWVYSLYPSFGYFDHPPMVAAFIKLGTLFFGNTEIGVRFIFNLATVVSMRLIWSLAGKQHIWTFVVLMLSYPLMMGAGLLALPDTPLLFFGTLFFFFVSKYIEKDNVFTSFAILISVIGLIYSKYHGLVLLFFTIVAYPDFLKRKSFWTIVFISFVCYTPYLKWLYDSDFVTFKYHIFERKQRPLEVMNVLNFVGGQLVLGAGFASIILYSVLVAFKAPDKISKIAKVNILGLLSLLLFSSLRSKIEANWTTLNFLFLTLYLWKIHEIKNLKFFPYVKFLAAPMLIILLGLRIVITLPSGQSEFFKRTNEVHNWDSIALIVKEVAGDQKVVANTYQMAAKLYFYMKEPVPALHFKRRSSHFTFLNLDKDIDPNEKITFVSYIKFPNSKEIRFNYPEPLYITPNISIVEIQREIFK